MNRDLSNPRVPSNARGCIPSKRPAWERMLDRIIVDDDGCWVWQGSVNFKGYARFRDDAGRKVTVHRFTYEAANGPIPDGLTIDHLCRNTSCCNPAHLEVVTNAENIRRGSQGQWNRRKTHCVNGHPYSGSNLYVMPRGDRICRACQRASGRRYDTKMRERHREARNI